MKNFKFFSIFNFGFSLWKLFAFWEKKMGQSGDTSQSSIDFLTFFWKNYRPFWSKISRDFVCFPCNTSINTLIKIVTFTFFWCFKIVKLQFHSILDHMCCLTGIYLQMLPIGNILPTKQQKQQISKLEKLKLLIFRYTWFFGLTMCLVR